jgi:hypothetical protein
MFRTTKAVKQPITTVLSYSIFFLFNPWENAKWATRLQIWPLYLGIGTKSGIDLICIRSCWLVGILGESSHRWQGNALLGKRKRDGEHAQLLIRRRDPARRNELSHTSYSSEYELVLLHLGCFFILLPKLWSADREIHYYRRRPGTQASVVTTLESSPMVEMAKSIEQLQLCGCFVDRYRPSLWGLHFVVRTKRAQPGNTEAINFVGKMAWMCLCYRHQIQEGVRWGFAWFTQTCVCQICRLSGLLEKMLCLCLTRCRHVKKCTQSSRKNIHHSPLCAIAVMQLQVVEQPLSSPTLDVHHFATAAEAAYIYQWRFAMALPFCIIGSTLYPLYRSGHFSWITNLV